MYNAAASWKMHYFLYNKHELFCKREFLTMQQGHLQEQLQMNWSEVCFRIFSPLEHFLIPLFQFSLLCFIFFFSLKLKSLVHLQWPAFTHLMTVCFLFQYDIKHTNELSQRLVDRIMAECPMVVRNGDAGHMYPGR